jgi:hypothetical protein
MSDFQEPTPEEQDQALAELVAKEEFEQRREDRAKARAKLTAPIEEKKPARKRKVSGLPTQEEWDAAIRNAPTLPQKEIDKIKKQRPDLYREEV